MKNRIKTYLVTGILWVFSCYLLPVNAADLTTTDPSPSVLFDDTPGAGLDWALDGWDSSFRIWNYNTSKNLLWFDVLADMQLTMQTTTFSIRDQSGNTVVNVHRDAPEIALDILSNGDVSLAGGSIFIDTSANKLGIGTTIPNENLEIQSSGPRILFDDTTILSTDWLVGNTNNDFVFKITSNAPFNPTGEIMTLDAQTGFVGVGPGTSFTPTAELHVKGAANRVNLIVENSGTGAAKLNLKNSESNWLFNANSTLRITTGGTTAELFIWPTSGDMEVRGTLTTGGTITSGGTTCGGGCDEVFAPEFKLDSIEDHAGQMWANRYLPAVGPTEANKPMNLTEKTGGILNELEKAHIYIEQLHTRNLSLEQRVHELELQNQRVVELEQQNQRIEELEQLVMRLVANQTKQVAMH